jgi:hypothetical protein
MAKNKLGWFVVEKAGRVVDCIRAKDLCLAFQEAMDKWEHWCEKGTRIEVKPMSDAPAKIDVAPVVVVATRAEVQTYAEKKQPSGFGNWPYFSNAALAENE